MILLEEKGDLDKNLCTPLEMKFMEEVKLNNSTILTIRILNAEDIQLCYAIK